MFYWLRNRWRDPKRNWTLIVFWSLVISFILFCAGSLLGGFIFLILAVVMWAVGYEERKL